MDESKGPTSGSNDGADDGDRVGYGNPPRHSRFKPRRSGNRKGRPLGARGRKKIIKRIASELHWIDEGGKRRRRSTLDMVLLSLRNLGLNGNVRAFRANLRLQERYGPQEPLEPPAYILLPETLTFAEWEKEAQRVERCIAEMVRSSKW